MITPTFIISQKTISLPGCTDLVTKEADLVLLFCESGRSYSAKSYRPESGPLDDVLPPVPGELGQAAVLAQPLPQGHPASQAEEAQERQQAHTPLHPCTWGCERCLSS